LCDFLSASYRSGSIINAIVKGKTDSQISNTFKNARLIGQAILTRKFEYIHNIKSSFIHNDTKNIICDDESNWIARFDPGLIIDLPRIEIETSFGVFSSRSCLTVCVGGAQSKIWTRVVRKISDDISSLDKKELETINNISNIFTKSANEKIRSMYEEDFSQTIESDVSLNIFGKINLFAVDCVGSKISEEIKENNLNAYWDNNKRSLPVGEISDVIRNISEISLPNTAHDNSPDPEFSLKETASFVPFKSSKGTHSLFVATTNHDHAYLSGVVDAGSNIKNPNRDENHLPLSLGTTAELASQLGAAY